jgi:glycogen(starch) synthase
VRIVLLPSAYAPAVGGVEVLTARLAHHLVTLGHAVEVWTIRHPAELPAVEVIDGVTVRRFAMSMPAGSVGQLARFGPGAWRAISQMRQALREFSADVLHVQCFSANGVYAAALSALLRTPLVVSLQGETVMDDNDIYDRSTSLRLGLRAGLRAAARVTGCSAFVLEDAVRRFGLPPGAGQVIPNGVDLTELPAPEPVELPFGRFVVALGRVVAKKGFDLLIDAFAEVAGAHPDVGLVIGGDGAARAGLIEQARSLGLSDRIALPGPLSRAQVTWAMQNAAVFVLPSRIEPFGIVVLEALRACRPVVVSMHGGATEIVRDEREGLVADPFNPAALASAIARMLDDGKLRERLTRAGEARIRAFDWPLVAARYRAIYLSVT